MSQSEIDADILKAEILDGIKNVGIWKPAAEVGEAENGRIPATISGQSPTFYLKQKAQERVFAMAASKGIFIVLVNNIRVD